MSVIGSNVLAGASGQSAGGGGGGGGGGAAISRSLRFNPGDSAYLNRTPSSSGNLKTWTWSGWIKRSNSGAGHTNDFFSCGVNIHNGGAGGAQANAYFDVDGTMQVYEYSGGYGYNYRTTQVFRDLSAWYHIVISLDTTNSTAGDRVKIYVNGDRVTSFSTSNAPALNFEGEVNKSGVQHYISDTVALFNGYLAEINFIDGQALAPTDFGETNANNLWVPKTFAGTYGPLVDQSRTWSSDWTGDFYSGYGPTLAFNNDFGHGVAVDYPSNGATGRTVTISPAISGSVIRVNYARSNTSTPASINGTETLPSTGAGSTYQWHTLTATSISSVTLSHDAIGSSYITAIEVDGKLLVDSGVSVANNSFHLDFADNSSNAALGTDTSGNNNTWTVNNLEAAPGGGTPVSSATGALPVYNTTDSAGKVKGTGTRTDSNSSYLVVAVPFDAGNTVDVSNSINTNSTTKSFTTSGSFASNASNIFYGSSTDFNGSSSLSTTSSSSDFTFGTGDFTIEYWAQYDDISASNSQVGDFQTSTTSGGLSTSSSTGIKNNFYPSGQLNFSLDAVGAGFITGLATGTWYHIAMVRENGSVRLYKDGTLQATNTNARDVTATYINIGGYYSSGYLRNGQMQDFRVYKGVAKYTSNFTIVAPGNAALQPGTDSLVDTPTNGDTASDTGAGGEITGNYAVLNPLQNITGDTFSNGNLTVNTSSSNYGTHTSTVATPLSGKWYAEVTVVSTSGFVTVGIVSADSTFTTTSWPGSLNGAAYYSYNGERYIDTATQGAAATFGANDVIGIAYDADSSTVTFYKNGASQGTLTSIPLRKYFFGGSNYDAGGSAELDWNFGQRAFAYPLSGYKSLSTANLSSTIADGSLYFDTKLYTGDGQSSKAVTGYNFSPDFLWIKERSSTSDHGLWNTVVGSGKYMLSNSTSAEYNTTTELSSIDSAGFTVGSAGMTNQSSQTYAAWAWDAGDLATTSDTTNYNQSQAWSSNITTTGYSGNWWPANPKTYIFDADTTNYGHANANGGAVTVTLTVNPTITSTSSVTIYGGMQGSGTATVSINGGTAVALTSGSSATTETVVSFSGAVSSIVITKTSYAAEGLLIYGFKIDGKRLLDPGIISAGSLNSSAYDQSRTWSNDASGGSYDSGQGIANAFNGNTTGSSKVAAAYPGSTTISFSPAISGNKIEFLYGKTPSTGLFTINGTEELPATASATSYVWNTSSATTVSSVTINHTGTGASFWVAMKVDGKLLVDSGVSVTNVPSIASTVRANPSAGFSIVTYTGTGSALTVGHGLNAAPEFLIVKNRTSAASWFVYHKSIGATKYLKLETTDAEATGGLWSNTDPTSSVVFSSGASTGSSGQDYLMLAFAPVEGYSAMGKYTGNGNASGPMVYTSMRPKLVLIKRTDATSAWRLFDTERSSYNVVSNLLQPNDSAAELTGTYIDILSNGFKIRTTNVNYNASGGTFIWAAFAEHPFASNGGLAR